MNKIKTLLALSFALWCSLSFSQTSDSLGTIGDNLDLYAVLDAFKNSENLEAFEKAINDPENKINNLDLDEDGQVDYIQVHDEVEGNAHAIILRIDMGENESQDVAVIEIEKSGDNEATIQIIGDEELYVKDYIIEPVQDAKITERLFHTNFVAVNVWGWRCVRFIYAPGYVVWHSPYRWNHYPNGWKPWKPYHWGVYRGFHAHHHAHYNHVNIRRCNKAHGIYVKKHRTCVRIKQHQHHPAHHGGQHKKGNNGQHKGPNGGQKVNKGGQHSGGKSSNKKH